MSFLHSVSVNCTQDFSFGILKKCPFLRDPVLPQTNRFPITKMPLNLVGPGFYTSFHVPSFSCLSHAVNKSMLLPFCIVFLQV